MRTTQLGCPFLPGGTVPTTEGKLPSNTVQDTYPQKSSETGPGLGGGTHDVDDVAIEVALDEIVRGADVDGDGRAETVGLSNAQTPRFQA